MNSGPALTPEGEVAWLRMKQHLEWCDSFALVFLFSNQPAVTNILRERLAAIYRARVTRLEVPLPPSPKELLEGLLPRLLRPPSYEQALGAPIWLDLTRAPAGTNWQQARLQFLARLNEQREPLRASPAPTARPGPAPRREVPHQGPGPGPLGRAPLQSGHRPMAQQRCRACPNGLHRRGNRALPAR